MMALFLSWLVLGSASTLFALKLWHWYDVHQDWKIARCEDQVPAPIFVQARGAMRLAWIRVVDGVLWLALASLVFWGAYYLPTTLMSVPLRVTLLVLILFEMGKISIDRVTRTEVMHEVRRKHVEQTALQEMGAHLEKEVHKGTEAAHAAYEEANSVNVKIADLNKRLLKEEETAAPTASLEPAPVKVEVVNAPLAVEVSDTGKTKKEKKP